MKYILLSLLLCSCGMSEIGTKGIAQVKRVHSVNPILCPQYKVLDASLGVMINGIGSMSTQDIYLTVTDEQATFLQQAAERGKLVELTYSTRRLTLCEEKRVLTSFKIVESK